MPSIGKVRFKLQVLRWRKQNLDPRLEINLRRAGKFLQGKIRHAISIKYPRASYPGEPPRRRSGRLWMSIDYYVGPSRSGKSMVARVGSADVPYARRLEYGFVGTDIAGNNINQAPRPYLRATTAKYSREVGKIIAGGSA